MIFLMMMMIGSLIILHLIFLAGVIGIMKGQQIIWAMVVGMFLRTPANPEQMPPQEKYTVSFQFSNASTSSMQFVQGQGPE
jgi:hypothetical protein